MFNQLWNDPRSRRCRAHRDRGRSKPSRRPACESLDERCLLSGDVVIQWNQAVLAAIRNDRPSLGFLTRDLAIVQTAIYDAVNAIDHTGSTFRVHADVKDAGRVVDGVHRVIDRCTYDGQIAR